jgi:chitinase
LFFVCDRFYFLAAGKVDVADIDGALPLCNYLVHGYAGINSETNKLVSLNETNDLDTGVVRAFRTVTTLKKKYSSLKVLLSVGGGADPNQENYFKVLESSGSRLAFINSVYTMIKVRAYGTGQNFAKC